MKYVFSAVIQKQEENYFLATVPDLPGIVVGASCLSEVLTLLSDACAMWLVDAEDGNETIPNATEQSAIEKDAGDILTLVLADTNSYRLMNARE